MSGAKFKLDYEKVLTMTFETNQSGAICTVCMYIGLCME